MSLDVYLVLKGVQNLTEGEHIFIRENGQTREIGLEEWRGRFPGRKPVVVAIPSDDEEVYSRNITHNLASMANAAGIYEVLWRPEEVGITKAEQLIEPLRVGLAVLRDDPPKFRQHNPPNGWGSFEGLVDFVESYLTACEEYPEAEVRVSR